MTLVACLFTDSSEELINLILKFIRKIADKLIKWQFNIFLIFEFWKLSKNLSQITIFQSNLSVKAVIKISNPI